MGRLVKENNLINTGWHPLVTSLLWETKMNITQATDPFDDAPPIERIQHIWKRRRKIQKVENWECVGDLQSTTNGGMFTTI